MSNHTPGPWILVPNGTPNLPDDPHYWGISAGPGYFDEYEPTAGFHITACISPANAALIAAAPELLAALEACLFREDIADDEIGDVIRAAIAKAKGETA